MAPPDQRDLGAGAPVGMGGRGQSLARTFARDPRVQLAYMCDPDEDRGGRLFQMLKDEHNPNLKRMIDFLVALIFVVICMPFFPILWLLQRRYFGGHVIHDERIGKDNKRIRLYRFGTTYADK